MKLAIFDIDGTLTRTSGMDDRAYVEALSEVFGIRDVDTDWSRYRHATDSGILDEIFEKRRGRPPAAKERDRFRASYHRRLERELSAVPPRELAAPGAAALADAFSADPCWRMAVATGASAFAAGLKLAAAALALGHVPAASSDDAPARADILRRALLLASEAYAVAEWEGVVSVGDGVWDVQAARAVGMGFVGVGVNARAAVLREAGATAVLPDFADWQALRAALEQAARTLG